MQREVTNERLEDVAKNYYGTIRAMALELLAVRKEESMPLTINEPKTVFREEK